MRPEILLYSSLLLALPTDLLIRLRNKNLLALRAAFQAHPVHDNHRCDYIERPQKIKISSCSTCPPQFFLASRACKRLPDTCQEAV